MKRPEGTRCLLFVLPIFAVLPHLKGAKAVLAQTTSQPQAQSGSAPSGSTAPKSPAAVIPYVPQLIHLPDRPPADPADQMQILDPTTSHPAPIEQDAEAAFPDMVDDGKGGLMVARAKESFSNLTLEGSELVAQEPVFGSREEKPTFIRELWQLRWRPNDPIDFYIILPRNVKKAPVVLYLYGFPSDTDRFKNDGFCERVTRNGTAAIGFVSALTGQRYRFRPFKNWFISELPESLASTVHDVQMILNQLKTRQDLDLSRIGMFGQGSGGAIAIMAAAVDPRIKALDLLDPWGDWPAWFAKSDSFPEVERATYLKPEFLKSLEPLDPVKYLPTLKDREVRMQFVKENREPEEAVKQLIAVTPSTSAVKQFAKGHDFYEAYSGGQLFLWMANELHARPGDPTQADTSPGRPLQ